MEPSDIQKIRDLFSKLGIEFIEVSDSETTHIICEYGKNKIEGNHWCKTFFEFDLNGNFICMGAYED